MNPWGVGLTVAILIVSLFLIWSVTQWDIPVQPGEDKGVLEWVLLQPNRCAQIPWRDAWAHAHQRPVTEFPHEAELAFVKSYYESKGIPVIDVKLTYQVTDSACTSCGCPEKFVFAVYTFRQDAARLALSGFRVVDTGDPDIFTGPLFRQSIEQPVSFVKSTDCDNVLSSGGVLEGFFGSSKDSCYIQAAISAKDAGICTSVLEKSAKATCYSEVAVALGSTVPCDLSPSQSAREHCIASVAGALKDPALCVGLQDPNAKLVCEVSQT